MKNRDKRSLVIASFPYKWRRSFHAIDDLPKPGDPAYDERDVLRGYRSHGGAVVGGGLLGEQEGEGRDRTTQYDGYAVVREQSAHHKRRGVVVKASPRVKYIDVDVVQKRVVRKFEPAELALELDMPGEPLSHHEQRDGGQELLRHCEGGGFGRAGWHLGSFLLPARRRRSTSTGKSGARRTSWREGVLKDADEPHLPTRVLGVYWKA